MDELSKNVTHLPSDGTAAPTPAPAPVASVVSPTAPLSPKHSLPKKIFKLLGILLIGFVAFSGGMYVMSMQQSPDKIDVKITPTLTGKTAQVENPYRMKNNTVVEVVDGKERVLFTNVKGATAVRPGPDGNTIHFRVPEESESHDCADLQNVMLDDAMNTTPVPKNDYTFINYPGMYRSCIGGYLENSAYFSYLVIDADKKGTVVIENDLMEKIAEIPVEQQLLSGFLDGTESKVNSYWITSTAGKDGKSYYYPHNDSYPFEGKILLSFGRLLVGVDVEKDKFIGGKALVEPDFNVITSSFWFITQEKMPLVIVDSGWEGVGIYQALIDVSGDTLAVENLYKLDKPGFNLLDLKKITWGEKDVKITLYDEVDVSSKIDDIRATIKDYQDEGQVEAAEKNAYDRLKQDKSYYDVVCMLDLGMIAGCFAAQDIVTYSYAPGGPLKKL